MSFQQCSNQLFSKSGGITTDILMKVLKHFDVKKVFPCDADDSIPFLLVYGHNTRLDPKFVEYIDDNVHCWKVCLGVQYATLLWQVGDSAENNDTFETEWYCQKDALLLWKYERGLGCVISHHNVIPLINLVFPTAFQ